MKMEQEASRMDALLEEREWREGLLGIMFSMSVFTRKWHGLRSSARKR